MRRATGCLKWLEGKPIISIHALHEESDYAEHLQLTVVDKFQSTLSMRRATGGDFTRPLTSEISIHALHEESDRAFP